VFEPGTFAPLAKVEGERRYGVVTDHLGTPRMMADEAGALAWKAQLDVFGVALNDVALTACPWRWPGQYEDEETGLYYNRFRYYDPETGRYVSQDPIGLDGGLYVYAYAQDALYWVDPFGLARRCGPARKDTKWDHIFDRHWYGGATAKTSGIKTIFDRLEKNEIMQVVDEAWRLRERVGTQIGVDGEVRIRYLATVEMRNFRGVVEMWLNQKTRTLESAYPKAGVMGR
jgi:RHS repeat-associated protein